MAALNNNLISLRNRLVVENATLDMNGSNPIVAKHHHIGRPRGGNALNARHTCLLPPSSRVSISDPAHSSGRSTQDENAAVSPPRGVPTLWRTVKGFDQGSLGRAMFGLYVNHVHPDGPSSETAVVEALTQTTLPWTSCGRESRKITGSLRRLTASSVRSV